MTSPPRSGPAEETAQGRLTRGNRQLGTTQRHQQSSERICIEHAIAEPKQWRTLQRYLGRREYFEETSLAIAGLVSDRAAAR